MPRRAKTTKSKYVWRTTPCKNAVDLQTQLQFISDHGWRIQNQVPDGKGGFLIVWCHYEGSGPGDRKGKAAPETENAE